MAYFIAIVLMFLKVFLMVGKGILKVYTLMITSPKLSCLDHVYVNMDHIILRINLDNLESSV